MAPARRPRRRIASGVVIDSEWIGTQPRLGHDQISMTQDVYMNRKATGGSAAKALADLPLDS